MLIAGIMTAQVMTILPEARVGELKAIFDSRAFHHLLVVSEEKVLGIVSDRDVLRAVSPFANTKVQAPKDQFTLNRTAAQIMTANPVTVRDNAGIRDAGKLFLDHDVSLLPVVDGKDRLIGVLSWKDVMRYIV